MALIENQALPATDLSAAPFRPVPLQIDAFRQRVDALRTLVATYAVGVKPYHRSDLPLFRKLSESAQDQALQGLESFEETLNATLRAGFRLDNQPQLVWHALKSMGLVPPSELFHHIGPDHVVEIYSLEGLQIWRNLNFLKNCSYTLEEVYSIPWHLRYERQPDRVEEAMTKVGKLLRGETPALYHADISSHRIEETISEARFVLSVSHHWLARLEDREGSFRAWMGISDSKIVETRGAYMGSVQENDRAPGVALPGLSI